MAQCMYCKKEISKTKTFCNKSHEKLWHNENNGNTFTAFVSDSVEEVEGRKARMSEYYKYHPLACDGDREARQWMRQTLRLRAIWDDVNKRDVRL